eukprot:1768172-Rhodomonas_salina.1
MSVPTCKRHAECVSAGCAGAHAKGAHGSAGHAMIAKGKGGHGSTGHARAAGLGLKMGWQSGLKARAENTSSHARIGKRYLLRVEAQAHTPRLLVAHPAQYRTARSRYVRTAYCVPDVSVPDSA